MKLNDAKLRNLATPGKHFDGGGLYLEVTPAGGRYWRLKYRHTGKEKRPLRARACRLTRPLAISCLRER